MGNKTNEIIKKKILRIIMIMIMKKKTDLLFLSCF